MPKNVPRNFAPPSPAIEAAVQRSRWSYQIRNEAGRNPSVHVRGVIGISQAYNEYGGDYAGTFRELEAEIGALGDVPEIDLYLFSPGGYVWPAMALHNLIQRHPARFNGIVDGLAASSATIILMACDLVRVPRNAQLMIHNATSWADGDHRELERMARLLRRETRNIADLYAERIAASTGREDRPAILEEMLALMNDETYLTGAECLAMGLADEVDEEIDLPGAMNRHRRELGSLNLANLPDTVRRLFDSPPVATSPTNSESQPNATNAMPDPSPTPAPPATPPADPPANSAPATQPADPPANSAPATPPASPPAEPPANPADMATIIANAVAAGNKPLQDQVTTLAAKVENLENLRASGAPANAFGAQPPVPSPSAGPAPGATPAAPKNAREKISLGLSNLLGDKLTK